MGHARTSRRAKGLCFPLKPLSSPPGKVSPVGLRLPALTCRKNISQHGKISKGFPLKEVMPGCCSLPKTMFPRSEVLETSIFMALLDPTLCRDSSRSGVPTCVEQDSSFLQLEHNVIRNHPPEKPICRRELPKAGVPGESCHITTALSHRPGAGSCSAFVNAVPLGVQRHQKMPMRCSCCTRCSFTVFTVGWRTSSIIWGLGWELVSIPQAALFPVALLGTCLRHLSPASLPVLGHFRLVSDLSLTHTRHPGKESLWQGMPEPRGLRLTGFIPI